MKKRFKKVYIEITNNCNLSCSFCAPDNRKKEFMSLENFETIISQIKEYTDYIYLHIKGEPLLHPNINEIIDLAYNSKININITTNGYLIENLKTKNIRQINYSIGSAKNIDDLKKNIIELKKYIAGTNIYLSLRLWVDKIKNNEEIINYLKEEFNIVNDFKDKCKLDENIFLSIEKEFVWPDLENEMFQTEGYCYALKDHIGILVDGTVIPCCLDHKGTINLGNIFATDFKKILVSDRLNNMLSAFKNRKLTECLCMKCGFLEVQKKEIL
jgi:Predicted Fe-S oxidoreductases